MNPVNTHGAGERNLDRLAAKTAQSLISAAKQRGMKPKDVENSATKTLGVLQENGIYAAALYLLSRTGDELNRAHVIREAILDLLKALPFGWTFPGSRDAESVLNAIINQVTDAQGAAGLERLILAKDTLEQMLIYTRYSAKAWKQDAPVAPSTAEPNEQGQTPPPVTPAAPAAQE